jgi:hypothetical protein
MKPIKLLVTLVVASAAILSGCATNTNNITYVYQDEMNRMSTEKAQQPTTRDVYGIIKPVKLFNDIEYTNSMNSLSRITGVIIGHHLDKYANQSTKTALTCGLIEPSGVGGYKPSYKYGVPAKNTGAVAKSPRNKVYHPNAPVLNGDGFIKLAQSSQTKNRASECVFRISEYFPHDRFNRTTGTHENTMYMDFNQVLPTVIRIADYYYDVGVYDRKVAEAKKAQADKAKAKSQ